MARGPITKGLHICFGNVRGMRSSPQVSSLFEISKLKRLEPQRHRVPREAANVLRLRGSYSAVSTFSTPIAPSTSAAASI